MAKQSLSAIVPFLIVTLLCVGCVELFYLGLEKYLLEPAKKKTISVIAAQEEAQPVETDGAKKDVDYGVITRRNLFGPPPSGTEAIEKGPPQPEVAPEPTTLDVVLLGTVGAEEENGRAIILRKKDRSQDLYQVGEMIDGAIIKEIQRGKVILTVDGRDEMLDISEARQFMQANSPPVSAAPMMRRRPVTMAAPQTNENLADPTPRVVQPLRRIVRPRTAIVAEQVEQENMEPGADITETPESEVEISEDNQVQNSEETPVE